MAHFRGIIHGARGEASRLGHKTTGLTAEAVGWNIGGIVEVSHHDGTDWVTFYLTTGSADHRGTVIARYCLRNGEAVLT